MERLQEAFAAFGLTGEELSKVEALGVTSPELLAGMMQAAPADLRRYLGPELFGKFEAAADLHAGDIVAKSVDDWSPPPLGVLIDVSPPAILPSDVDIARRDRLVAEIGRLRAAGASDQLIREKQRELDALLDVVGT